MRRDGTVGIGRPGALQHDGAGHWSRRIAAEHRRVHKTAGASQGAATTTESRSAGGVASSAALTPTAR